MTRPLMRYGAWQTAIDYPWECEKCEAVNDPDDSTCWNCAEQEEGSDDENT